MKDSLGTEAHLVGRLARARARTYPPGYVAEGWRRWIPETDEDLQDTRVWISCLAFASHSAVVAEEVAQAWAAERRELVAHLDRTAYDEAPDDVAAAAEILQAVVLGLAFHRVLDPGATYERAEALLARTVAALAPPA